jgi:hypothetical protein
MRIIAAIVVILGLAVLVMGVLFITQAASAKQEIADQIAPLPTADVAAKYDEVAAKQGQVKAAEEPKIQAGQAGPSDMYNYLSVQRTSLGLAKANLGTANFVRMSGMVDALLGLALVLAGWMLFKKSAA